MKITITSTTKIKVSGLEPGGKFKLPNQRKFRQVGRSAPLMLDNTNSSYEPAFGKILLVLNDCKQMLLDPDTEVVIPG